MNSSEHQIIWETPISFSKNTLSLNSLNYDSFTDTEGLIVALKVDEVVKNQTYLFKFADIAWMQIENEEITGILHSSENSANLGTTRILESSEKLSDLRKATIGDSSIEDTYFDRKLSHYRILLSDVTVEIICTMLLEVTTLNT